MPKQSVSLERNDFLQYLHLTQSEAAKHHNVSLSCFKRYFHQLFRPRIHWSTKKDRIILRKAINYPVNNIVTEELVEKFLSGSLRGDMEEEKPENVEKCSSQHMKEFMETKSLLQDYESKQKLLQQLIANNTATNFKGYPEFLDGPWKDDPSWTIPEGKLSIPWTGLVVCDHNWQIISCNDMFSVLTGYSFIDMIQGVTWYSLLPRSCNMGFLRTVFDTVMMSASTISTTLSLISKTRGILKMYVTIRRFSEGYYILIENNDSTANVAYLSIDKNEFQIPCVESSESSLQQALYAQTQQLQLLFDYGLMRQQQGMETNSFDINGITHAPHPHPWHLPLETRNPLFNF